MTNLKELINYLDERNISNNIINNQVIIKRRDYDHYLITKLFDKKNKIDIFYLDSTIVFYINENIINN